MRLTEVSDLRWPYLTLTLIYRNVKGHIQSCIDTNLINYPHSSQSHHAKLCLLTISLKSCEGCSSYDVITSWPDLTRPNFFHQKFRKWCPISYGKFQHDPPNGVASSSEKLMGGLHQPPLTWRGLIGVDNVATHFSIKTLAQHRAAIVSYFVVSKIIEFRKYFLTP